MNNHWADAVVTPPTVEPLSLTEVKARLRLPTDSTAEDSDLRGLMLAARKQVEKDLAGCCLAPTVIDHWIDGYTSTTAIVIPRWPLASVTSITSYDADDVATVLSSADYLVDTVSRPGRVIINADAAWPSSLRTHKSLVVRHTSGFGGSAKSVSSITRSSTTATVTTAAAHGYSTGNRITIAGAIQEDYNGTFEVTVTGSATFTYTVANSPTTPATGTLTASNLAIPESYTLAMTLLVGHWYANREAVVVGSGQTLFDLAYASLLSDAPVVLG